MYLYLLLASFLHCAFSNCYYWAEHQIAHKAVIRVPVADAVDYPLGSLEKRIAVEKLYNNLPCAPDIDVDACPRIHQLLFNEVVTIKQELGAEIECEVSHFFYYDEDGKLSNSFWILKKNVIPLEQLKKMLHCVPAPYCSNTRSRCSHKGIVTLAWPWFDTVTQNYYSAGTRFVRAQEFDTENAYGIIVLKNDKTVKVETTCIPLEYCVIDYPQEGQEGKYLYVELIKQWISNSKNIIPYIWGGCSFIRTDSKDIILKKYGKLYGKNVPYWTRPGFTVKPYTGCECSALILRAAQIYGIPYFFKNTAALSRHLIPLTSDHVLEKGDLIWYPGHVLIVSDIDHNEILESVGYTIGYGKIHSVPLKRVFKDIETYKQLLDAYYAKKSLIRLAKDGSVGRIIHHFTLFKLDSKW